MVLGRIKQLVDNFVDNSYLRIGVLVFYIANVLLQYERVEKGHLLFPVLVVLEILAVLFFMEVMRSCIEEGKDYKAIYAFSFVTTLHFLLNDSYSFLLWFSILATAQVYFRDKKQIVEIMFKNLLVTGFTIEILGFLYRFGYLENSGAVIGIFGRIWVDLVVLLILLAVCFLERLEHMPDIVLLIVTCLVQTVSIIFIGFMLFHTHNDRVNRMNDTPEHFEVYILDANKPSKALTVMGDTLRFKDLSFEQTQKFTVTDSEEEGYLHIWTYNGRVVDILNVIFEEGNRVIVWEEAGNEGQHWKIVQAEDGTFQFQAHGNELLLNHDDSRYGSQTKLTANHTDATARFILRTTEETRHAILHWGDNHGKQYNLIYFIVEIVCVAGLWGITLLEGKRQEQEDEDSEEN